MMLYVRHSKTNLSGNTMKNISLILVALLLFTFPLFAQTKRSNFMYQWKNGSKYFGEWENGTLHGEGTYTFGTVSYTHLRAHETDQYLVCRLLLEKKN